MVILQLKRMPFSPSFIFWMAWRTGGWSFYWAAWVWTKESAGSVIWKGRRWTLCEGKDAITRWTLKAVLKILFSDSTFKLTSKRRRVSFIKRFLMINYLDVEGRSSTCIKKFQVWGQFLNSTGGSFLVGSQSFLSGMKWKKKNYDPTKFRGLQMSSRLILSRCSKTSKWSCKL